MCSANTASYFRQGKTVPKHNLKNNMTWDVRNNQFVGFGKVIDVLNRGTELLTHYLPPKVQEIPDVIEEPTERKMRSRDLVQLKEVIVPGALVAKKPKRNTGLGASSAKSGSYTLKQYKEGVLKAINSVANDKGLVGFISSAEAQRLVDEAVAAKEKEAKSRIAKVKKNHVPEGYKSPAEVEHLLELEQNKKKARKDQIIQPNHPEAPELTEKECQRRIKLAVDAALALEAERQRNTPMIPVVAQPRVRLNENIYFVDGTMVFLYFNSPAG